MIKLQSKKPSTIEEKLRTVAQTRALAAESLHYTLSHADVLGGIISEKTFRDAWLANLSSHASVFPEGWYIDPPAGMAVLAGVPLRDSRINYSNLRMEQVWPKPDIFLGGDNEMLYVYASPVDRKTGIIGDFAMTLYSGKDKDLIKHIKTCLTINHEIADHVTVGMSFAEIYRFAESRFKEYGLTNTITSVTDPAKVNIGHTVPASYEDWSPDELETLKAGDTNWDRVVTMISKKRKFINAIELQPVQGGMAITLEPRLTHPRDPTFPMSSYHTILIVKEDGSKELLTNFDDIFKFSGMDYML